MCLPTDEASLTCWLHNQLRVLEAWCAELGAKPDADLDRLEALERHRHWLAAELAKIE